MPGGNGTGPSGMGPMTGRAAGYCAGYSLPGYINVLRRRFSLGRGIGRGGFRGSPAPGFGLGRGGLPRSMERFPGYSKASVSPYQAPTKEEERSFLEEQSKLLKEEIKGLEKRIEELTK